jgi:hypothetical protein
MVPIQYFDMRCFSELRMVKGTKNGISLAFLSNANRLRFIPEGVAEASQIFLEESHILQK